mmetsp:Transcript_10936/g.45493  ORF Transcript_10936/g.45493 Transcript_10936/m.45493 type:complete len:87 (+) Transcript_10936:1920-2180(+)
MTRDNNQSSIRTPRRQRESSFREETIQTSWVVTKDTKQPAETEPTWPIRPRHSRTSGTNLDVTLLPYIQRLAILTGEKQDAEDARQ